MALGSCDRSVFWNCDLAQSRGGIAPFALRGCFTLARDCFGSGGDNPGLAEFCIRFSEDSNLGLVRPIRSAFPAQRPFLVVDRRDGLAKSASAKFSLLSDPDRLRDRGFTFVRSQLETRNALGTWHCHRAQSD